MRKRLKSKIRKTFDRKEIFSTVRTYLPAVLLGGRPDSEKDIYQASLHGMLKRK